MPDSLHSFRVNLPRWLPLLVGSVMLVATLFLWRTLTEASQEQISQNTLSALANLRSSLSERIDSRIRALDRMAHRTEIHPQITQIEWQSDADLYLLHEKSYALLEWINPDLHTRWIASLDGAEKPFDPAAEPLRHNAMLIAENEHRPVLTQVFRMADGSKAFLACLPFYPNDHFGGLISGTFRVASLFDGVVTGAGLTEYSLDVIGKIGPLYHWGAEPTAEVLPYRQTIHFQYQDIDWQLVLTPSVPLVHRTIGILPDLILALGLSLCAALTYLMQVTRRSHLRDREMNETLQQRVIERTEELRKSEESFRFLTDVMPQIIWTSQPSGAVEYLNQYWTLYTGLSREAGIAGAWEKVLHPDEAAVAQENWERARRTGTEVTEEYRFRRIDGHYRWHQVRSLPQRDSTGRILRWIGTSIDVHEQREARSLLELRVAARTADLVASEERFRMLASSAPIGIFRTDTSGRAIYLNPRWHEITGMSDEAMGEGWTKALHPEDLRRVTNEWETASHRGLPFRNEFRFVTPDGETRWVECRAAAIRDGKGNLSGHVGTLTDITEIRALHEKLVQQNAVLEAESALAQEANRLKSEFLANMSHELRTPLNGIIGFSEFLYDQKPGPLNPKQREFLDDVLKSARHLLQLINDLLDLAKVEAGRMELAPESFSLRETAAEADTMLEPLLLQKKIAFSTIDELEDVTVTLDPQKIKQILFNLLSNAVKFTNEGGQVTLRMAARGPEQICLSVSDTGIGIRQEDLSRLFGEFEQLDTGPGRRYQGTGLGLALTKKLVTLHGGTIGVESIFGKGTTFTVTLPRVLPQINSVK